MIELLKNDIVTGDTIRLTLTTGKEPEGEVLEIGDVFVIIKTTDGNSLRCFDKIIGGWEVLKRKASVIEANIVQEPKLDLTAIEPSIEVISAKKVHLDGPKVVGRIDLSEIREKKKVEKPVSFSSMDNPTAFKSFEELKKAIEETKLKRFLPANAEINRYFKEWNNGSAKTEGIEQILFKSEVILDESVKEELSRFERGNSIPVIVSYYSTGDKFVAEFVTKPSTVGHLIGLAKKLSFENKKTAASNIIQYLISNDIITSEIEQLRKSLPRKNQIVRKAISAKEDKDSSTQNEKAKKGDYASMLNQARKLRHAKGFDKSEGLFLQVIEANFSIDSAVKELADQYREQGNLEKAIELVEKHFSKFNKQEPAFNFLYDLYVKNNRYEKAIELSKEALTRIPKSDGKLNRTKRALVLTRLTVLLVKLNRKTEAEKYLDQAIELDPQNPSIKSLVEIISKGKENATQEEIEALFDESQFLTLVFGLSPFLQDALNSCEYDGIPPKVKERRNFSRHTITELREVIEATKTGRPELRAKFHLTEAKLLQEVDPGNVNGFYLALSKYCNAMAKVIAEMIGPMDVVREYYLNSFMIRDEWDSITNQVSLYIESIFSSSSQIVRSPGIGVIAALKKFYKVQEFKKPVWDLLLELFIVSKLASAKVLSVIYSEREMRESAIKYLSSLGISQVSSDKSAFIGSWNKAAQQRKSEKEELSNNYNSILKHEELHDVVSSVLANKDRFNKSFLSEIDLSRTLALYEICDIVQQFLTNSRFEDREFYFNSAESRLDEAIKEIERYPTTFSLTALKPSLSHILILLKYSYLRLINSSKPLLSVNVEGESSIADDKICEVQISISNKPDSSKVGEVTIEIDNLELGVNPVNVSHTFNQTLRGGGEPLITKFRIQVDDNVLKQGATVIGLKLFYKELATGETNTIQEELSVPFYDSSEFTEIHNPYAEHAKSNVVENPKMFKGRDELIQRINDTILTAKSKGYVIYGQKRSGKSSVLWHLDTRINKSGQALSVFFNFGLAIAQDGNVEVNLYYLILSNIEKVIRQMKIRGEVVPEIGKTNYKELAANPSIVFYERLSDIRNCFDMLESWRGRKIVLIIDEFTYLYYQIKKGNVPVTFMQKWKALVEDGAFSVILAGQDSMAKFMNEFQNEFAIFKGERLTYIDEKSARELVDEPIWDSSWHNGEGRSRYTGNSIDKILELTASSPFYIQIFCNELVRYMNLQKKRVVTPADIAELTDKLTSGVQGLGENDFENLMVGGDRDLDDVSQAEAKEILRQIALQTKNIPYCRREDINVYGVDKDTYIINDLLRRTVISEQEKHPDRYKIQVQLFKYWLLNHN